MRQPATAWLSLVVCLPGLTFAQAEAKGPEVLAQQVVSAFKTGNRQALESLVADRADFKKYIWPTIASRVNTGGKRTPTGFTPSTAKTAPPVWSSSLRPLAVKT